MNTPSRLIVSSYSLLFGLVALLVVFSLFSQPVLVHDGNGVLLRSQPGNLEQVSLANGALELWPENVAERYLPVEFRDALQSLKLQNQTFTTLKLLWLFLLFSALLAVFFRASHGAGFVVVVALVAVFYLYFSVFGIISPLREVLPEAWEPGAVPAGRQLFLVLNGVAVVILLASLGLVVYLWYAARRDDFFNRLPLTPMLLPLEKRNQYQAARRSRPSQLRSRLEHVFYISLIVFVSLLIGNLVYLPLFQLQVNFPMSTFVILALGMVLLQAFYLRGYHEALVTMQNSGHDVTAATKRLLPLSYLGFSIFSNVMKIWGYIIVVVIVVTALLLLIMQNISFLESIDVLAPRKTL